MPIFPPDDLLAKVERAFEESGADTVLLSPVQQRHPRVFLLQYANQSMEVWLYIWTLTHGGGPKRPAREYRIQLTGVTSPLRLNPNGPTLLLGYEAERHCFAGFDIRKHVTFTGRSPSVQIRIDVLDAAVEDGISFSARKGNDEIAVGFRPDYFLLYALHSLLLHDQAIDPATIDLLGRAAKLQLVEPAELERIAPERQRVVSTIARLTRAADFRRRILDAYKSTCAITGVQLRLIDAAHILPVGAEGSTDATTNGLCLSATYHRAFDSALIYLDQAYFMRLNRRRAEELRSEGLAAGIEQITARLNQRIILPGDERRWPDLEMIRKANAYRNIHD